MFENEAKEWKSFFLELITIIEEKAMYADVLFIDISEMEISRDNTTIDVETTGDKGIKLRAWNGLQFFEYGTYNIDKEQLRMQAKILAEKAKKVADGFQLAIDKGIGDKHFLQKGKINETDISIKEKIALTKELHTKVSEYSKLFVNVRIRYEELFEKKIFVNKESLLSQEIHGCLVVMVPFMQSEDGDTRYNYKNFFKAGYEVTNISSEAIQELCEMTLKIGKAKKIVPGKYLTILSPEITGLLAHESFGHGMESDTVYKDRAKAKEYLGKQIAKEYVSIIENPALLEKHGSYFFDDEGKISSPTYLIKNGIVNNPITELYSATRFPFPRSANGRCESYDHKAYARMSNIYFDKGTTPFSEMIEQIEEGIYLHNASGGMEDPKGWGTQIQGCLGERIKNGKRTGELFYEIGLTGYLPTILGNILSVSDTFSVEGSGQCGKGHKEWVRVSDGGPHLLIKDLDLS